MLNIKNIPKAVFTVWRVVGLLSTVFSIVSLTDIRIHYKDFSKVDFYLWLLTFGILSVALTIYIPRTKSSGE